MKKAEFIERWLPLPAKYSGQWDEFKSDLDELLKSEAVEFMEHIQKMPIYANYFPTETLTSEQVYDQWKTTKAL